ncbi:MAG: hypothetical protein DA405_01420 [Bacteroidetes bacterium]|nr:MAG: hypothetical protein DA405_01420 [Bacteroidota bacterium]
MKKLFSLLSLSALLVFSSCEEDVLNDFLGNGTLSESEIADGLKSALSVGTDTSSAKLGAEDGYFQDPLVKLLLPIATQNAIETFKAKQFSVGFLTISGNTVYNGTSILGITIPGLKSKEDELILGINRAAEAAANQAAPIFIDAITDMSIADANDILFGGIDTAATAYLRNTSYNTLFTTYEPKIDNALQQVTVGGTSISQTYEDFVADYNGTLAIGIPGFGTLGSLMNLQSISVSDLSAYSTNKGLDGLFLKIAEEEQDIRTNPLARINDLLVKVFSLLD